MKSSRKNRYNGYSIVWVDLDDGERRICPLSEKKPNFTRCGRFANGGSLIKVEADCECVRKCPTLVEGEVIPEKLDPFFEEVLVVEGKEVDPEEVSTDIDDIDPEEFFRVG